MSALEYEKQFLSISTFVSHLYFLDEVLVKIFDDKYHPRIGCLVAVECLRTWMDVVEAASL